MKLFARAAPPAPFFLCSFYFLFYFEIQIIRKSVVSITWFALDLAG